WTLADAGGAKVKEFVPGRFVDDVHDLKGAEIASEGGELAQYGLDHPQITIDLVGEGGAKLGRIVATQGGQGKEKKLYAAAEGSPVVSTVRDYAYERIDKKHDDFLDTATPIPNAGATPAANAAASGAPPPAEIEKQIPLPPAAEGGEEPDDL